MTHDELVAYCLGKPGATPDEPWEGDLVAKVGGKIFAFLGSGAIGVKCGRDADEAAELRLRFPDSVSVSHYIGR
jgi:predicted DNA-binding protein (MmcQ/YjbR family)